MQVVHSWTQFQSRSTKPFVENTNIDISFVSNCYMQALQQHLHTIQSTITVTKSSLPSPFWSGDIALMDQASKLTFTRTHELKCINAVRLFHRVFFLSELCNVDGTKIRSQWYSGETNEYYIPNLYIFIRPNQTGKATVYGPSSWIHSQYHLKITIFYLHWVNGMQLVTAKEAFGTNITIIHRRKFSSKSQDWKNQIFGTRLIPSHDLASFLPTAHSIPIGV